MPKKEPEDDMFSLDPIFEYEMTDQESKTFKVCLIWMKLCQKMLPDYKYTRIPKNGDPRKCHLFRIIWKLLRETNGILEDKDIAPYIRAQLEILQGIKRANGTHVLIDPGCLTGEKAWVRWKMWRRKFELATREVTQARGEEERTPLFKIAQEVDRTKAYFARFYNPYPTREEVGQMITSGNLKKWIVLGKVSPYYVLMSPYCRAIFQQIKIADYFTGVDFSLFIPDVTSESQAMFKLKFPHEFELT